MLDSIKVGNFIMGKRKSLGMTQQQLADKLNVSFQAISKWENGTTYPNIEILRDLAIVLDVSVQMKSWQGVKERRKGYLTVRRELI